MSYKTVPKEFDLNTEFPTWIIAFCPDPSNWFVTNKRFFYYEYEKEFKTEEEGIEFFIKNPKIFYDIENQMGIYRPSFDENKVWLENIGKTIEVQ